MPARIVHLENGQFGNSSPADVEAMIQEFAAAPGNPPLVVHFHGGLVSAADGTAIAQRLHGEYSLAGGFPVFFVWESAWYETIGNNLSEILKEDFFKALLKLVAGKVLDKLGVDESGARSALRSPTADARELSRAERGEEPFAGVAPGPLAPERATLTPAEEAVFRRQLEQDQDFARAAKAIVDAVDAAPAGTAARSLAAGTTRLSTSVLEQIRLEKEKDKPRALGITARLLKGAVVVVVKVIARFARKRAHGIHATIVEEILREFYAGEALGLVWEMMKKDTADAFGPDPARFGGSAMLAALGRMLAGGQRPRILLVGHSTGAVYICNWLRAAEAVLPPDVRFEVAFLAPACTVQLLARTLNAHAGRIAKFRMFTMRDALEQKDAMIRGAKLLYPRSLLYFISGVLEEKADFPVAGMERFYLGAPFDDAQYPEIARVRAFLDAAQDSRVWSRQTGVAGQESESEAHADFDNDPKTVASLRHLIAHGF
jgi:hypothetical protein